MNYSVVLKKLVIWKIFHTQNQVQLFYFLYFSEIKKYIFIINFQELFLLFYQNIIG